MISYSVYVYNIIFPEPYYFNYTFCYNRSWMAHWYSYLQQLDLQLTY